MIARVLLIARRELLELRRQPVMWALVAALFAMVAALALGALGLLQAVAADSVAQAALAARWGRHEMLVETVVSAYNWLIFTQLLGVVGVLAGHTVLHDRQVGALPFLLLAPVRRVELMAGKVLGVLVLPLALYLVFSGGAAWIAASLPVTAPNASRLPPSPSWAVAFFLGGPAWSLFVAAICAAISGLSRDVRTAQQAVWFALFFATFAAGTLLALPVSAGTQLQIAALGLVAGLATLYAAGAAMSREIKG